MKTILILTAVLFLSGCVNPQDVQPSVLITYDPNTSAITYERKGNTDIQGFHYSKDVNGVSAGFEKALSKDDVVIKSFEASIEQSKALSEMATLIKELAK